MAQDVSEGSLQSTATRTLRVAVTGSRGFVGAALVRSLEAEGHIVRPMVRREDATDAEIAWQPTAGRVDEARLAEVDAVVHLAGESIFSARWTVGKKRRILQSRVEGTRLLAETLARMAARPTVLVCASGIHYYGDTGNTAVDEQRPLGEGFLAAVCAAWERAADAARDAGVRVVHLRFGVVLHKDGGALRLMLPAYRLGLGGPIGSGKQWMSVIGRADAVSILRRALVDEEMEGPFNVVLPDPIRQREFAKALGAALHRPALLPTPPFALRLALGREQAEETVLFSSRVVPRRLLDLGHRYQAPTLEETLRHALGG